VIVVKPGLLPVTTPALPTVATVVLLLLHAPPVETSDSVIVEPTHTLPGPRIGGGGALTVNSVVATQPVAGA
jgi:hypothetical protein